MLSDHFEASRKAFKPVRVDVLFVGESRPSGGTFFYQGDSNLFRETKKAFDEYFGQNIFSLDAFKDWNCWLYDICKNPVNCLDDEAREDEIQRNMPCLEKCVGSENPKYIVICKRGAVRAAVSLSSIMSKYRENETLFFLPFPSNGRQKEYREGLVGALTTMDFTP